VAWRGYTLFVLVCIVTILVTCSCDIFLLFQREMYEMYLQKVPKCTFRDVLLSISKNVFSVNSVVNTDLLLKHLTVDDGCCLMRCLFKWTEIGQQAFCISAPTVWNSLSGSLLSSNSVTHSKQK